MVLTPLSLFVLGISFLIIVSLGRKNFLTCFEFDRALSVRICYENFSVAIAESLRHSKS